MLEWCLDVFKSQPQRHAEKYAKIVNGKIVKSGGWFDCKTVTLVIEPKPGTWHQASACDPLVTHAIEISGKGLNMTSAFEDLLMFIAMRENMRTVNDLCEWIEMKEL